MRLGSRERLSIGYQQQQWEIHLSHPESVEGSEEEEEDREEAGSVNMGLAAWSVSEKVTMPSGQQPLLLPDFSARLPMNCAEAALHPNRTSHCEEAAAFNKESALFFFLFSLN